MHSSFRCFITGFFIAVRRRRAVLAALAGSGVVCSALAAGDATVWESLDAAAHSGGDSLTLEVLAAQQPVARLQIGEALQYRLRTAGPGHCYLLHVDSRFRATLIGPPGCARGTAAAGPVDILFPQSGGLAADYPAGEDVVYAIVAPEPLATLDRLLDGGMGVAGLPVQDAEAIAGTLVDAAREGVLQVASVAYEVAEAPAATQFTTRGIIRKVIAGREGSAAAAREAGLASFAVNEIHFDFGSDRLTEESKRELDVFGAALLSSELDGIRLRVAGHTDDVGAEEYNYALSLRRASAVKAYLVSRFNINASRLDTVGFGERRPVVESDDSEARALNRRVEMVFLEGQLRP